jgi:hypothetical protein
LIAATGFDRDRIICDECRSATSHRATSIADFSLDELTVSG